MPQGNGIRRSKDLRARVRKFLILTNERKQMSKMTLRKRISLVAVTALTAGVLSVVTAPVASANIALSTNVAPVTTGVNVAVGSNTSGAVALPITGANTAGIARSLGLVYKDASSTTAQTATVLNTGALVLYTLNGATATNIAFVASGGTWGTTLGDADTNAANTNATATYNNDRTILLASVVASTAISVSWSTSTIGTYTISVYISSDGANIAGLTDTSDGTLIGGITVSVVSSATATAAGAISAANSTCVTDSAAGAITSTSDSTGVVANGNPWYVKYILRDGTGASNATLGNIVATATNGALLSLSNGTQAAGTSSTVVGFNTGAVDGLDTVRIDQPTAGAPLTTTLTIQYNGVTVCTKTVTIRGAADKMTFANVGTVDLGGSDTNNNWLGQGANNYAGHFNILLTDSAGNIVLPAATTEFSLLATSATTTITAIAVGEIATLNSSSTSQHRYTVGRFTCGPTAGSSTVTVLYTNAATGKITSAPLTGRCADDPSTYTASFDKASYRQGEIATLTLKFLDSKGNPANSMDAVGASSIILPMMTLVSATGAATALTKANGEIEYTLTVGTSTGMTAGTYAGIIDFTALTAVAAVRATPSYTLTTGGDTTTNADVLKSIVALIASINKQIQALQKLILKR